MSNKAFTIYLIDDDPLDADLTKRALMRCLKNAEISWFEKASEALIDVKHKAQVEILPDLIFIDLKMPGMNGLEWLKEVRKFCGMEELPIVVFSSSNLYEDKKSALNADANLYLVKPTELSEFRSVVKEAITSILID